MKNNKINKEETLEKFSKLMDIVESLRGENGCPWDKKQTHSSLKGSLLEEAKEATEAIQIWEEQQDTDPLVEELGDVLFHILLHSQIGKEEGSFELVDVIDAISFKMVHRHPHVFDRENYEKESVHKTWAELKAEEKALKKQRKSCEKE